MTAPFPVSLVKRLRRFLRRLLAYVASLFGLGVHRICATRIGSNRFCDYCDCRDCREGSKHSRQYLCVDGSHICGTCLLVEPCFDVLPRLGQKRTMSVFCEKHPFCLHKPVVPELANNAPFSAIRSELNDRNYSVIKKV